tara:strand:+ start:573 stop:686 length:114 start_codon:yes stop_codon:yes gene_type:complete
MRRGQWLFLGFGLSVIGFSLQNAGIPCTNGFLEPKRK